MATGSNSRDVRLGIKIETAGEETLKRAAQDVRKLGEAGLLSADDVTRLTTAFDKLGAQAGATSALKAATEQVDILAQKQREAATATESLGAELQQARGALDPFAKQQQTLAESTARARKEIADSRAALSTLREQYDAAGRKTTVFTSRQAALKNAINGARQTIADNSLELVKLRPALTQAAAAERTLAAQYDRSKATLEAASAALRDRNRQLDSARAAALAAGVATTDLAEAENTLLTAARATAEETERLTAARREATAAVVAMNALDEQNVAVLKRQQQQLIATAAAYEADVAGALQKAETEALQAKEAFEQLASAQKQALSDAFGQTGVRSLQAIRTEINGVSSSLTVLKQKYAEGSISAQDLARATSSAEVRVAALRRELQTIPALPNIFEKLNSSITNTINRFGSLTAAIATVGFAVKPVIDANIQLENLRRTLTFVTGSGETAAAQIRFLQEAADNAGLSVGRLTNDFSLFEASVVKSGLSVQVAQDLFGGVSAAAGVLGINTERVSKILLALGQVANKGKVSLEELQGQIGESLPGALKLAADSIGVTTGELGKLLADGKLLAEDFLPAFARQLNETFGQGQEKVTGLAQAFNRVRNAATLTSQQLLDTSAYRALTKAIEGIASNFDTIVSSTGSLIKAFVAFKALDSAREFLGIKAAAEAVASAKLAEVAVTQKSTVATAAQTVAVSRSTTAIASETTAVAANTAAKRANAVATTSAAAGAAAGALAAVSTGFSKVVESTQKATSRVTAFIGALGGPYGLALTGAIAFSDQLGNALANLAAKVTGVSARLKENEALLLAQAEAEKKAAEEFAKSSEIRSQGFTSLQVQYDKLTAAAEANVRVSAKLVKAKKEEGDAAVTLAGLSGDEAEAKQAAAVAAKGNEDALRSELRARQEEFSLLQKQREELAAAAGAQNTWSEARKEFFRDFDQDLEKKKADIELTRQSVEAESAAAAQAQATARAYQDNAESIDVFRDAVEGARIVLEAQRQRLKEGLVTQDQVNQSARELAKAQGLLRDAYRDASEAVKRRSAAYRETIGLQQQDIELARARIAADLKLSEITGEYTDTLGAAQKVKDLDIKQSQQKIAASKQEAALLREEARLMQDQLTINDPLYEQKKRAIDAILNSARAKEKEGLIEQQNLRTLKAEYDRLNPSLYQAAKGFTAVGDAAADAARKIDVFSEAGRTARNADINDSNSIDARFNSSSGFLPVTGTGTIFTPPPDNSGDWVWKPMLGRNRAGGEWVRSPAAEQRDFQQQQASLGLVQDQYGIWRRATPAPAPAPAPVASAAQSQSLQLRLAQAEALRAGDQSLANQLAVLAAVSTQSAIQPAASTYTVNVTIGNKQYSIGTTSKSASDKLIDALEAAQAAGG